MPKDDYDQFKKDFDADLRDANYAARGGYWFTNKWVLACILSVLAMIAVVWVAQVLSAGPKGAGDAYKTNQSGTNRIAKQEMFQQLYEDIQVADINVTTLHTLKVADPSYVNNTNYTAAVMQCTQLVHNYNAEAKKYTSQDWRDNSLPSAIDQTDPKFDCKEEAK